MELASRGRDVDPALVLAMLDEPGTTAKAALRSTASGSVPACASAARAHEPFVEENGSFAYLHFCK
jgi:hypothetical protein